MKLLNLRKNFLCQGENIVIVTRFKMFTFSALHQSFLSQKLLPVNVIFFIILSATCLLDTRLAALLIGSDCVIVPFRASRLCPCFYRILQRQVSKEVIDGGSVHAWLDLTSEIKIYFFGFILGQMCLFRAPHIFILN